MPKLFMIGNYAVYFWSNENGEPVHIHIAEGVPSPNGTKVWLTAAGGCIAANNNSRIPQNRLNELLEIITAQHFMICREWKKHFKTDRLSFYC